MEKIELIDSLREELRTGSAKVEWYRQMQCVHLFELSICERRALWDSIILIEQAKSKAALLEQLCDLLREAEGILSYVQNGLIQLAEFLQIAHLVYHHVWLLVKYDLETF